MSENIKQGEELFDKLSQEKKKRKHKKIRTVLIIIAVIVAILAGLALYLRHRVQEMFASAQAEVLSHTVATGTIHTTVSGDGVLAEVDEEALTVPAGVEITEVKAEAGDIVSQGDLLATVDVSSVMSALSSIQDDIKSLDSDLSDAKGDTVSSNITTRVSGRVKALYGEPDMDVTACMAEHGALALLSLDEKMAVDIETDILHKGDTVAVTLEDGTQTEGTVESVVDGIATVTLTDNGPKLNETVVLTDANGNDLGSGSLYIHSPLAITGYAGTISQVNARENSFIYSGATLYTLRNTSFSANYDALLRQRADLEDTQMQLLTLYRDGAYLAPMDGRVSSVEYDEDTAVSSTETALLTLSPSKQMSVTISVDETDILALEEGQTAQVEVSSVSDEIFSGTVTSISKVADTSSGVTQYSAEITLDRAAGMLSGMTASIDVQIEGVENALIIPVDALHQTSAGYFVYTTYDEETHQYGGMTEVTIGMQNDTQVEIASGLREGDTVYYTKSTTFMDMFAVMGGGNAMGGGNNMGSMPAGNPHGGNDWGGQAPGNWNGNGGGRP